MSLEETKKLTTKIDGWLLDKEVEFLYKTSKSCQGKGVIVEIGSFKGKSTVCLALGSKNGKNLKIYAIDPHISDFEHRLYNQKKSTFKIFQSNIKEAGIANIVNPIVKSSKEAVKDWSRSIEFLWIDGDHSYQGAKADFDLYSPFMAEGGIIAFHDSTQGDVLRVVQEVFRKEGFRNFGLVDSILYASKNKGGKSIKDYFILFLHKNYNKFHKLPFKKYYKNFFKKVISKI